MEEWEADVRTRVAAVLGCPLEPETSKIHQIRDVAPHKMMMRASFRVPAAAAFETIEGGYGGGGGGGGDDSGGGDGGGGDEESAAKRQRSE
jgi:hypothetical protein